MTASSSEGPRGHAAGSAHTAAPFLFPGQWIGGAGLMVGPLLIAAGALLRIRFDFFAPQQLAAHQEHPTLITTAYSCYSIGSVVLCLGVIYLANLIGRWSPVRVGGAACLAIIGSFNRTFSSGADHLAFQLLRVRNV